MRWSRARRLIRTATWDVVAWNRAATVVLTDYGALPPEQRNILRMMFLDPQRARRAVRLGKRRAVRGGRVPGRTRRAPARRRKCEPLVDELCRLSPEFEAMWRDNDVRSHGEGVKHIRHPVLGPLAFEYSAFAVDGRPDLSMVVYNPATPADAEKIRSLSGVPRRGQSAS